MAEDLTVFLNARLGEAEAAAEAMDHVTAVSELYACPATRSAPLGDLKWGEGSCDCGLEERKARALRDVAAKWRIVDDYRICVGACRRVTGPEIDGPGYRAMCAGRDALRAACLALAGIWADHPDYREQWTPGSAQAMTVIAEYGQMMPGGGFGVRPGDLLAESVYPVARWIEHQRRDYGRAYRRRIIVVEDWAEVDAP